MTAKEMFCPAELNEVYMYLDDDVQLMFFGNGKDVFMLPLEDVLAEVKEEELALNFKHQYIL